MNADDFAPTASWSVLELRAKLLKQLRAFFDERGFLEVETPLLSADTVVDRHLDPIPVVMNADFGKCRTMWLQTSPEFAMKRLLASGANAIFQVTRAFRHGEAGALHNPEFTIVEWYRAGDNFAQAMQLLSDLSDHLLAAGQAERLSYRDAFQNYAGIDPHAADVAALRQAATDRNIALPNFKAEDRDSWLDLLLVKLVEPNLGIERPTVLFDYPASQAALAKIRDDDPPLAERFELYVRGVELANGYHELLDAAELRARNTAANAHRLSDGKETLPETSRLLAAMEYGLPSCAGVALGFDRLVMLTAGVNDIRDVLAFPADRA